MSSYNSSVYSAVDRAEYNDLLCVLIKWDTPFNVSSRIPADRKKQQEILAINILRLNVRR